MKVKFILKISDEMGKCNFNYNEELFIPSYFLIELKTQGFSLPNHSQLEIMHEAQ